MSKYKTELVVPGLASRRVNGKLIKGTLEENPSRVSIIEKSSKNRVSAVGAGALLAAGLFWIASHGNGVQATPTADERFVCTPSEQTHIVHTDSNTTFGGLVHEIGGSGDGRGDPCWSESTKLVERTINGTIVPVDTDIVLPDHITVTEEIN